MKQKELGAIAKSLSEMAVSNRIDGKLEAVASFDEGTIEIDLLEMTAADSNVGKVTIQITADLNEWFCSQVLTKLGSGVVTEVLLELQYDSSELKTNREKLLLYSLCCNSTIKTQNKEFKGNSTNRIWYHRNT